MTDPMRPDHEQPVEGPRSAAYSGSAGAETTSDPAGDAGADASGRVNDVFESIRDAVEDLAEKAAPVVREISVKAAEVVAVAADKAAPLVQRAGEATADASGKLAEKSRTWASDMRDSMTGRDAGPADMADSVGDAARHAAEDVSGSAKDVADGIHDAAEDAARSNPPL